MPASPARSYPALPDRIRSILATRGLSLADVSRSSRSLAFDNRLHHIPHNFYSAFRNRLFSPSIYQVLSLSIFSGYRLVDWLAVFGFSLDDASHFQISFPALRTVELDSRVYQAGALIAWFCDLQEPDFEAPLVPLSRWLTATTPRRFDSLSVERNSSYRYLKIGLQDAFAFPELLPGSVVRVKRLPNAFKRMPVGKTADGSLFLVEHSGGLLCSRLCRSERRKVVLCSRHLPYAPVELVTGTEALVSGVVDLEIRPLGGVEKPVVPARLGRFWVPGLLTRPSRKRNFGELIRRARILSGFSFREASARTKLIARKLEDRRYYCAAGSLSDCETRQLPPRHIHKLISICATYFGSAETFLEASGVSLHKAGKLPMPPEFLDAPVRDAHSTVKPSHFLSEMERRFGELPFFLHNSLSSLFRLPDISVRDVFWVAGTTGGVHPYFAGAFLLAVDRKQKIPRPSLSRPKWAQPVFVLQRRDGSHLCGFCSLQNGVLIVRSCLAGLPKLLRLRNRIDAEVVGRVVGVVRRLE
jgi:hypothetical protein